MGYICLKGCTLSGISYVPGQLIPDEAIQASRAGILKAEGRIVEAHQEGHGIEHSLETGPSVITLATEDGSLISVGPETLEAIITMATATSKNAAEMISQSTDKDALMALRLYDSRKAALEAIASRMEELEG